MSLIFFTFLVQTDEELQTEERDSLSTFFDLFIITLIPILLFTGKSHFILLKFLIEHIFYAFAYDFILIINRDKSRSLSLLIGCISTMSISSLIDILLVSVCLHNCKKYEKSNPQKRNPAITEDGYINLNKMFGNGVTLLFIIVQVFFYIASLIIPLVSGYLMYKGHVF